MSGNNNYENQYNHAPPPPPYPQQQQQKWTPPPYAPKTNGKAIAALVLGLCAFSFIYVGYIIGIVGIIFSALALKELKHSEQQGRGMAIAGLVINIVVTSLYTIAVLIFLIILIIGLSGGYENDYYYSNYNVASNLLLSLRA
ncbi:DUF4190 domain-containing protein [Paenibacillus sp. NPDC058071]|uniref:DUF4190 domain-containing protein n=1 Tax=Paenibacillus sp. NPDC058071 TaxID=3346326 RepID=UPI0036DE56D3